MWPFAAGERIELRGGLDRLAEVIQPAKSCAVRLAMK